MKIIDSYEYVSFDIFDTLVRRDVKVPEDVFQKVEDYYNKKYPEDCIKRFKEVRQESYYRAKSCSSFEEVSLEEIYESMIEYTIEQRKVLMNIEIIVEKDLIHVCESMLSIYQECVRKGKKIFITSDMYLPAYFIENILQDAGYGSYDKLYLSCTERVTKKSGHLFQKLLEDNQVSQKSIVHIGDSFFHDYLGASKVGVKALLIKK